MIKLEEYFKKEVKNGLIEKDKSISDDPIKVNAIIKIKKENDKKTQTVKVASIYRVVCDVEGNIFIQRTSPASRNKYSVCKNELSKFLWEPKVGQSIMIKKGGKKIYRVVYMHATVVITPQKEIYIF